MGAYIAFGIEARHLLAAVIMTAPGTILIAKMLVPETEKPLTDGIEYVAFFAIEFYVWKLVSAS